MLEEKIDALFDVVKDLAVDMKYVKGKVDFLETEMNRRFELVDERFEAIDARFEKIENDMDARFMAVDARFEQMENRFEKIDKRFEKLKNDMDARRSEERRVGKE